MSSVGDLRVPATVAIVLAPQLLSLLRIAFVGRQHAAPHRMLFQTEMISRKQRRVGAIHGHNKMECHLP